jgi:prepilin-type processing-associated H-X9-DG protein
VYDRTSHLAPNLKPLGGNIGFVDGHASWRKWQSMTNRYGNPRFEF